MTFVNEYITDEDYQRYGIASIDRIFLVGGTKRRDWTIDRERDIYLRQVASGREDLSSESTWTFYWRGALLVIKRVSDGTGVKKDASGVSHMTSVIKGFLAPPGFQNYEAEMRQDLRAAFNAYGGGGVFSSGKYVHELTFDSDQQGEAV